MPITYIDIEWPDNQKDRVYSPSSIIKDFLPTGKQFTPAEFKDKCTEGLEEASERVRQKFGYACTAAQAEVSRIKEKCTQYEATAKIKIVVLKKETI